MEINLYLTISNDLLYFFTLKQSNIVIEFEFTVMVLYFRVENIVMNKKKITIYLE